MQNHQFSNCGVLIEEYFYAEQRSLVLDGFDQNLVHLFIELRSI